MGSRRKHDVFVIGDELSSAETMVLPDPATPGADQEPDGHSQPSGLGRPDSGPRRARILAGLATAGGAAATLFALTSSHSGSGGSENLTSSSRSALVHAPAPRAAVPPAPATRPLPDRRRPESSHGRSAAEHRSQTTALEPEREPTPSPAPESSQLPVTSPSVPEAPAPAPPAPSPPPSPDGGGPGVTEQFGFER